MPLTPPRHNADMLGLLVIGSEILNARRRDSHLPHVTQWAASRGIRLTWAGFHDDHLPRLARAMVGALAAGHPVFTCGGIGATPDDPTRQAVALAAGVPLEPHPEAARLIVERYGDRAYPDRIGMALWPRGSVLIPNPVNGIAAFEFANLFCLPGFPTMAWPMMDWVAQNRLNLPEETEWQRALVLHGVGEGDLIPLLSRMEQGYPQLALSCLPGVTETDPVAELSLRGRPATLVESAFQDLQNGLRAMGATRWEICDQNDSRQKLTG
ncbi:MAG: molybdopterin-binding protein [Magnetococcus sp. WYHC-3]